MRLGGRTLSCEAFVLPNDVGSNQYQKRVILARAWAINCGSPKGGLDEFLVAGGKRVTAGYFHVVKGAYKEIYKNFRKN